MTTNFKDEKKRLSERLKQYHDWNFTPGKYEHSIFGLAALLLDVDAAPMVHGRWINTPPYYALNGQYNKGQECSVCHAFFVSPGNTPYSNHPYCCECGAKMDLEEM